MNECVSECVFCPFSIQGLLLCLYVCTCGPVFYILSLQTASKDIVHVVEWKDVQCFTGI